MDKKCFKCGSILPLSEFYKHPEMADGYLGKYKACTRKDVIENRRANTGYYREYDRKRFHEPVRRAYSYAKAKEQRALHPDRYKARAAVSNKRMTRMPCSNEPQQVSGRSHGSPARVLWAGHFMMRASN